MGLDLLFLLARSRAFYDDLVMIGFIVKLLFGFLSVLFFPLELSTSVLLIESLSLAKDWLVLMSKVLFMVTIDLRPFGLF
jgi:hypothetical protein